MRQRKRTAAAGGRASSCGASVSVGFGVGVCTAGTGAGRKWWWQAIGKRRPRGQVGECGVADGDGLWTNNGRWGSTQALVSADTCI